LDQLLHNIERDFFLKMQSYSALLTHFDDFAKSKNLNTEQTATSRMRELDKVKESFNKDLNEKDADSGSEDKDNCRPGSERPMVFRFLTPCTHRL
jgi:hypothetical protein